MWLTFKSSRSSNLACCVLLVALFGVLSSCFAGPPPDAAHSGKTVSGWAGTYVYAESAPPDLTMEYVVQVLENGRVDVTVNGHMTMIHVAAGAEPWGKNSLRIVFNHDLENGSGQGFKAGDVLFTLSKKGSSYLLRWGALTSQLGNTDATQVKISKTK